MTVSPDFSTASTVVAAAVAAYLLCVEPWLGRRIYASLARRRDSEPHALVGYFTFSIAFWCVSAVLVAAALLLSPGAHPGDLGVTAPDEPLYTAAGIVLFAVLAVTSGRMLRSPAERDRHVPGRDAVAALLPRTPRERRLAAVVAVVDAVGSELVYRGLLIAFAAGVLGFPLWTAAVLSVAVYAAAGWYQGRTGVVVFAFLGTVFTLLYLSTGSLLLPVVVHALLSVRDLVMIPAPDAPHTVPAGSGDTGGSAA